jgi:putative sporulation protein YtaF
LHASSLLAILAIGVASNLDNAGVGIAYGVRKIKIPWYSNMMIALISLLATGIAGFAGHVISKVITPLAANLMGTFVMITVGIWVMIQPYRKTKPAQPSKQLIGFMTRLLQKPEEADFDQSSTISLTESMFLGIALALNALAGGFDAGVTTLNIWGTALSVGLFSYLLLWLAAYLGERYAAERLGDKAAIVAGIMLILVGIHQIL